MLTVLGSGWSWFFRSPVLSVLVSRALGSIPKAPTKISIPSPLCFMAFEALWQELGILFRFLLFSLNGPLELQNLIDEKFFLLINTRFDLWLRFWGQFTFQSSKEFQAFNIQGQILVSTYIICLTLETLFSISNISMCDHLTGAPNVILHVEYLDVWPLVWLTKRYSPRSIFRWATTCLTHQTLFSTFNI